MIEFVLPVWLRDQPEIEALTRAFSHWWARVEAWLLSPLEHLDADTCHPIILGMLAWQRDLLRLPDEAEGKYRRRVKVAGLNTADSGELAGFTDIFGRLGLAVVKITERVYDEDWDVVRIELADSLTAADQELLAFVVEQYGRTCRRYEFVTTSVVELYSGVGAFGVESRSFLAEI